MQLLLQEVLQLLTQSVAEAVVATAEAVVLVIQVMLVALQLFIILLLTEVLLEVEHQVIREPLETHQEFRLTYHHKFYLIIKEELQVLEGITPQDPVVLAVLVVFGYYQMKDNLWHI
jgi:hypothetical protein